MKDITATLNKSLQPIGFVDERLKLLHNKYEGETAYIIAAGPSLNDHSINELKSKLKDKLVFCIKQPYYNFKDICDFLFLNFTNLSPFNFNSNTIVSWAYWFPQHPQIIQEKQWKADLLYPIIRNDSHSTLGRYGNSIAYKQDFENLMFDKSIERPWGPGLMYELAIPTAVHLGVKNIVTIGWDIGDINQWEDPNNSDERHFINHFYSDDTVLWEKFKINAEEIKITSNSVEGMYDFLASKDIGFTIISDANPASSRVPRMKLSDI